MAVWEEGTVDISINEVEADGAGENQSSILEAVEWLQSFLSDGPVKSSEATRQSRKDGIADRTLNRAKKKLEVLTSQRDRCHWWTLPEKVENNSPTVEASSESSFTF